MIIGKGICRFWMVGNREPNAEACMHYEWALLGISDLSSAITSG